MSTGNLEYSYQLSDMQQGMLFHTLHSPRAGAHIMQVVWGLHENLDVGTLKQAWQRVSDHHPALRTSFRWQGLSEPLQDVHKRIEVPFQQMDWRNLPADDQKKKFDDYLKSDRGRGFDPAIAPLMRVTLFRLAEQDYKLVWTFHHALLDGRCLPAIIKQVFSCYEAILNRQAIALEPLPLYRDYIEWLRQRDLSQAEMFWREELKGISSSTPLPLAQASAKPGDDSWYARHEIGISATLVSSLVSLAEKHGFSLNTILQGAWAVLLSRYSGEEDVTFGITKTCRRSSARGADSMIGLIINTLPLRVRLAPEKSVLQWLKEIRSRNHELRKYEHTPLVKVQGWSDVTAGSPLFESLLIFENYLLNTLLRQQGGSWLNRDFRLIQQTNYPLTISSYKDSELFLHVQYDRRRIDDASIVQIFRHFETLLEGIANNPEQRLSQLSLLTQSERQQLLTQWNDTRIKYRRRRSVIELFEQQVDQTPNATALIDRRQRLTYSQLDERANQLAHYLHRRGVGPELMVGLCLTRSAMLVVAVLAIMKAGAAYVPLDPTYPRRRLAFILEEADCGLLLTQSRLAEHLPDSQTEAVMIDALCHEVEAMSRQRLQIERDEKELAYVIYTSGSTGKPKGVAIEQQSVVAFVNWIRQAYTDEELSGVLASTSVCFDLSVYEMMGPLCHGGKLIMADDALRVGELEARQEVSLINTVPSAMAEVMRMGLLPDGVKTVNLAGEPLQRRLAEEVYEGRRVERVVNLYGPTEYTTYATSKEVSRSGGKVTIGKPIANTQVYVLDERLMAVPLGVAGEVYIGGAGLARGYLKRAEMTAERFVPDPYSREAGARMYGTGDLARRLDDGELEFIGRADYQVKVRGYRIELGEVEEALMEEGVVEEAVVVVRQDEQGAARLVGYVVSRAGQEVSSREVRRRLEQRLPGYMVPSAIVVIEKMPLTPNGKVDRKALPEAKTFGKMGSRGEADTTPVEEMVCGIWESLLGASGVGPTDNFFELGGHSLLVTRLVSRVREAFGVEVEIGEVFKRPTAAELSEAIEERMGMAGRRGTERIRRAKASKRERLSYAQQRLWFLREMEGGGSQYNLPVAYRLRGPLEVEALRRSVEEMVRRHEVLRTRIEAKEGVPAQVIDDEAEVDFKQVEAEGENDEERSRWLSREMKEEANREFDLEKGPVMRVKLIREGESQSVLMITTHHIASDGWSGGVMMKELGALYEAYRRAEESPLAELEVQYGDYARWQRERMEGEALSRQIEYWKKHLQGAPAVLGMATDRARPAVQSDRGASQRMELSREVSEGLKGVSRQEAATLYMVMLAAMKVMLMRYSGQEDVVVGSPIANRNRVEVEGLIGLFVNTLAVRTKVERRASLREVIRRVKESALGGYANQEVPFEKVVEEVEPERALSYSPVFQVMMVMQNEPRGELEMGGVKVSEMRVETGKVKYDLTLMVREREGRLEATWKYREELYEGVTIRRMGEHYERVLKAMIEDGRRKTGEVELMTAGEVHQVIAEWNDTSRKHQSGGCIHELFERQASITPQRIAVVDEQEQITYAQLNTRANQLARYLRKKGISPESLVGICVERSIQMVVGLFGILKSGGAYVPIDPGNPKERIHSVLSGEHIPLILTQRSLLTRLPEYEGEIVCLDSDWNLITNEEGRDLEAGIGGETLAYVIYTSGSTGESKGVMIEHRSAINLVAGLRESIYDDKNSPLRVSLNAPIFFDSSVKQLLQLLSGHTLSIIPDQVRRDGQALWRFLESNEINVFDCTPSQLRPLLAAGMSYPLKPSPLLLLVGGEEVDAALWSQLAEIPDATFYNVYGPTECTVDSAISIVRTTCGRPTIGRPIANTNILLLDKSQQPVPVGVPGEMHIAGAGLARGYFNKPDWSADRFIPNPFSNSPGERMYRTGDLCRYSLTGEIEYLGRVDEQVKVRGHRVETGEIEALLNEHESVGDAVVVLREDEPGHKKLVAYVVAKRPGNMDAPDLNSYLRQRLPEYMLPSAYVALDHIPLTRNGKVDRSALPPPEKSDVDFYDSSAVDIDPIQEIVINLMREVLGSEQINAHDNFFDLGGHSLLAMQLGLRIRQALDIELPVRNLFESPTASELVENVKAIIRKSPRAQTPPLIPVARNGDVPLSFAQQRLWFISQLEPDSRFYNISSPMRLTGELKVEALGRSLKALISRHESLRTTFKVVNEHVAQIVTSSPLFSLPLIDLTCLPDATTREAEMQRLTMQEAGRSFDLSEGPLIRTCLVRLSDSEHVLLLNLHHIVSDAWSRNILLNEMALLYEAFSQDEASPLKQLPVQYADYAAWQREWLKGEVLESHLNYWRRQLEGAPPVLELPTDRVRPAVQNYRGGKQRFDLGEEVAGGLRRISRAEGVTVFMTLMAAYKVLLMRYSGQGDVVVGTPIANRSRVEVEGVMGFFTNTMVMRTSLEGNPTFRELMRREKEVAIGAYTHQDMPFEKLVEEVRPDRSLSHTPVFQVAFNYQEAAVGEIEMRDVILSPILIDTAIAKFDLTFSVNNKNRSIVAGMEYSTELYDDLTISRMIGHLTTLLTSVIEDPNKPILDLPLLTEAESHQLLTEWTDTEAGRSEWQSVSKLFESQAERTPGERAVIFEGAELTYRELNSRANQLAHYLRSLGVGADTQVGICLERSIDMICAVLAVAKAGGACLPLDPSYPKERLAFMLEDACAPVILTQERLLASLPQNRARAICLDAAYDSIAGMGLTNPVSEASAESLAYVIYTSGSTGRPKGVGLPYRSLSNLVDWHRSSSGPRNTLQFASLNFDVSFQEIFSTLCSGGTLFLIEATLRLDTAALGRFIAENNIERFHIPNVMLQKLSEEFSDSPEMLASLREVMVGGEQLQITRQMAALFAGLKSCALHNHYGPSETHVVTSFVLPNATDCWPSLPPLGRPISNTRIYILDQDHNQVPIGIPGDLCIGGECLARGYHNRADLTAEKFIPDPYGKKPGGRLYKTGDLARYLPDGNIEFIARGDQQVKVRGMRVEPAEIESALRQHPAIHDAAVIAWEDSQSGKYLAAYVATDSRDHSVASTFRSFLKELLPAYMIPTAFVLLESLPLTPNGKIDRKALTCVEKTERGPGAIFAPPRSPIEEVLEGIWAEVLGVSHISRHDDFFELGGHSLLATQIIIRTREAFRIDVPLRSLFEAPTIAGLARNINVLIGGTPELDMSPLTAIPRTGVLNLSFAQERLWFQAQIEPDSYYYNLPITISIKGPLNIAAVTWSLDQVVRRHEGLRTTFSTINGWPVQVIAAQLKVDLPLVDISEISEGQRQEEFLRIIVDEARKPFNLAKGPLIRAVVVSPVEDSQVLLLTMHHIICDGWSMNILVRELDTFYKAFLEAETSPLEQLPIQYADYAAWQREWLKGEVLESHLNYWRRQLEGAPTLEIPTDRPRPAMLSYRGGKQPFQLEQEVASALKQISRTEGVTLYMTLLAAYKVLLMRYSGQEDIVVGTSIANRSRVEVEGVIGFFANLLVMRTSLEGNPTFRELMRREREVAIGAYTHQDMPFEKLVEEIRPDRKLSYTPLFRAAFNYQEAVAEESEFFGINLSPVKIDTAIAQFDLLLSVRSTEDSISGRIIYYKDLFEPAMISRMVMHFKTLLGSIARNPDARLSELEMLSEEELNILCTKISLHEEELNFSI